MSNGHEKISHRKKLQIIKFKKEGLISKKVKFKPWHTIFTIKSVKAIIIVTVLSIGKGTGK